MSLITSFLSPRYQREETEEMCKLRKIIFDTLLIAFKYGGSGCSDSYAHKAWVIDQMIRTLTGSEKEYTAWIAQYENDGEYSWETGIAP